MWHLRIFLLVILTTLQAIGGANSAAAQGDHDAGFHTSASYGWTYRWDPSIWEATGDVVDQAVELRSRNPVVLGAGPAGVATLSLYTWSADSATQCLSAILEDRRGRPDTEEVSAAGDVIEVAGIPDALEQKYDWIDTSAAFTGSVICAPIVRGEVYVSVELSSRTEVFEGAQKAIASNRLTVPHEALGKVRSFENAQFSLTWDGQGFRFSRFIQSATDSGIIGVSLVDDAPSLSLPVPPEIAHLFFRERTVLSIFVVPDTFSGNLQACTESEKGRTWELLLPSDAEAVAVLADLASEAADLTYPASIGSYPVEQESAFTQVEDHAGIDYWVRYDTWSHLECRPWGNASILVTHLSVLSYDSQALARRQQSVRDRYLSVISAVSSPSTAETDQLPVGSQVPETSDANALRPDINGLETPQVSGGESGNSILDSDRDGLTDDFEISRSGTDPAKPDTDGDGFDDGTELARGSDPLDPSSVP